MTFCNFKNLETTYLSQEMACDELKAERKKITAEALNEHQLATTAGTSTGQFKCGRCGKRNTTYNQVCHPYS